MTASVANDVGMAGESLELYKPGIPELDGTVPMIRVEKDEYGDNTPWPDEADGDGSLSS